MAKAGARMEKAKIVFSDFRMGCFSAKERNGSRTFEEKIKVTTNWKLGDFGYYIEKSCR
jgi:hypothetical protein